MKRATLVAVTGVPHTLAAVVLFAMGCPPPAVSPQTFFAADGATVVATPETACANLQTQCGTDPTQCATNIAALSGGSPLDLGCMSTAATKSAAAACIGVGALCVSP